MNGKLVTDVYEDGIANAELLNPFVHHLELETTYDKVKVSCNLSYPCTKYVCII